MADSLSLVTNASSPKGAGQASSSAAPGGDAAGEGEGAIPFAGVLDGALSESGEAAASAPVAEGELGPLLLSEPELLDTLVAESMELTGNDLPDGVTPFAWSMLTLIESPLPAPGVAMVATAPLGELQDSPELSIDYKPLSPYKPFLGDASGLNGTSNPLAPGKMAVSFEALMIDPGKGVDVTQFNTQTNPQPVNLASLGMTDIGTQASGKNDMPPVLAMPVPPQNPAWGTNLGERLQWIVGNNLQQAEIRLDPPELGTLEIKLSLQKEHAQVNIVAHHALAREAVDAAIPRLREMFADIGLNLGDVNVSQESFGQQQMAGDDTAGGGAGQGQDGQGLAAGEVEGVATGPVARQGQGLLDTFA